MHRRRTHFSRRTLLCYDFLACVPTFSCFALWLQGQLQMLQLFRQCYNFSTHGRFSFFGGSGRHPKKIQKNLSRPGTTSGLGGFWRSNLRGLQKSKNRSFERSRPISKETDASTRFCVKNYIVNIDVQPLRPYW